MEQPVHPSTSAVVIGMGIVRFAPLSTGKFIKPLNSFKKHQLQEAPRTAAESPAGFEPQREVEQEREEGESQSPAYSRPHCQRSAGLAAQAFCHHQQKTRDGCCRKLAGKLHVPVCGWHCRAARQERETENRTQPGNLRPGMERIPPATGVQDALVWRSVHPGTTKKDQHHLSSSWMWASFKGEPQDARAVYLCHVRLLQKCRPGRRYSRLKGGARPVSLSSEL